MQNKVKISALTIANVAMMVATMVAGKWVLSSLPNIEVVSLFTVVYTVFFGSITAFAVLVFLIVEGVVYGIGWWFYGYLIAWPLLFLITLLLRKRLNYISAALLSGLFGLSFGLLCEIPYSAMFGFESALSWWVAGIPYDIVHGVGNFVICLALYNPLMRALKATARENQ